MERVASAERSITFVMETQLEMDKAHQRRAASQAAEAHARSQRLETLIEESCRRMDSFGRKACE